MKSALARLGIRGFKLGLRTAPARLEGLRTPEGMPLPPNTLAELRRDLVRLHLIHDQIREIEAARLERLEQRPDDGAHPMVRLLARVIGVGIETADMLVQEILSRPLRDRRAVARYGGLTGAPDESGARRREKGLARAGNARVRRGMIQLAWRFLMFQKNSGLAQWYRARTADARGATRKTVIIALGAQVARRAVAAGDHRRDPAGCRSTRSGINRRAVTTHQPRLGTRSTCSPQAAYDDPRRRRPEAGMAVTPS